MNSVKKRGIGSGPPRRPPSRQSPGQGTGPGPGRQREGAGTSPHRRLRRCERLGRGPAAAIHADAGSPGLKVPGSRSSQEAGWSQRLPGSPQQTGSPFRVAKPGNAVLPCVQLRLLRGGYVKECFGPLRCMSCVDFSLFVVTLLRNTLAEEATFMLMLSVTQIRQPVQ